MKKNNKLTILSILTSAVMLTTSAPVDTTTNGYVSSYYDVLVDDITSEYKFEVDSINFVPEDDYVPQGIALVEEYVVVSSFDYYKDDNSKLCVYDSESNLVNECLLEHNAHVGGIAYDKENKLLWVTTSYGNISAYDVEDILCSSKAFARYKDLDVGDKLPNYMYPWVNSVSFLTLYNNELFVGNFSLRNTGRIKRYTIEFNNNKILLRYQGYFKIPNMVQGVTFYKKDNKEYIIFSRSYGRDCPSLLQIFRYDTEISDYRDDKLANVSLKMTPMLEQLTCVDNQIYTLFESNATPYVSSQDNEFDSISVLSVDELVKKLELKIGTN